MSGADMAAEMKNNPATCERIVKAINVKLD